MATCLRWCANQGASGREVPAGEDKPFKSEREEPRTRDGRAGLAGQPVQWSQGLLVMMFSTFVMYWDSSWPHEPENQKPTQPQTSPFD